MLVLVRFLLMLLSMIVLVLSAVWVMLVCMVSMFMIIFLVVRVCTMGSIWCSFLFVDGCCALGWVDFLFMLMRLVLLVISFRLCWMVVLGLS